MMKKNAFGGQDGLRMMGAGCFFLESNAIFVRKVHKNGICFTNCIEKVTGFV